MHSSWRSVAGSAAFKAVLCALSVVTAAAIDSRRRPVGPVGGPGFAAISAVAIVKGTVAAAGATGAAMYAMGTHRHCLDFPSFLRRCCRGLSGR